MNETMAVYRQIADGAMEGPKPVQLRMPQHPVPAEPTWPATAVHQVQAARHLLAEADEHLKKTLDLIQH
jgi:hypothetical protein